MTWTVGAVAKLAGISVRTLHHYDEIGLLSPSGRSTAGYRLYVREDLERLQEVLLFRELGLPLGEIRRLVLDPTLDRRSALEAQRRMLADRVLRGEALIASVGATLEAMEKGTLMDERDMLEVFGDFDPKEYEDEARERWGGTDAYKESARRTALYTKADWQRIKAEQDAITAAFADCLDRGVPVDAAEVGLVVARHHAALVENFYECSLEMYAGLGEMYVADPRFTRNIDKARAGLATYQRDAMRAWVATQR